MAESHGEGPTDATRHQRRFRFDFKFESIEKDSRTGAYRFVMVPDPARYEWKELDGRRVLIDRLDGVCFSEDCVRDMAAKMGGAPLQFQRQKIDDAQAYVQDRRGAIGSQLDGQAAAGAPCDMSADALGALEQDRLEFVVLSLDIVGSTALANTLPRSEYVGLVTTAMNELAAIVPLFHGHVLKYTGDGFLAYFPAPSFITKNDLAIDCALTLRLLVYEGLNPELARRGQAPISVRIGLDSGEAAVVVIGSEATKRHADLIGDVVSLACKIQALARPGGIALGDVTIRNAHTRWRLMAREVELPDSWKYQDRETRERYRVHEILPAGGDAAPT